MHISHENIYKSIFNKTIRKHLRSNKTKRRAKNSRSQNNMRGQIIDPITIRERPAAVEDRALGRRFNM